MFDLQNWLAGLGSWGILISKLGQLGLELDDS